MQANAAKRTPEQLAKALAAAQAELEALRLQLDQAAGGSDGQVGTAATVCTAGGSRGAQLAEGALRYRMSGARKWALVGALQLAGLMAYWRAAAELGCTA